MAAANANEVFGIYIYYLYPSQLIVKLLVILCFATLYIRVIHADEVMKYTNRMDDFSLYFKTIFWSRYHQSEASFDNSKNLLNNILCS